jgi:hypothetical protein
MVRRGINEMATFAHQTLLRLAHATVGIRAPDVGGGRRAPLDRRDRRIALP